MSRANLWIYLGLSAGITAVLLTGCKTGPQESELTHHEGREIRVWPPRDGGSGSGGVSAQIGDEEPASDPASVADLPPSERPAPGPRLVGFSAPPAAGPPTDSRTGAQTARKPTGPQQGASRLDAGSDARTARTGPPSGDGAQRTSPTPNADAAIPQNLTPELRSLYEKQLAAMRSYPAQQSLPSSANPLGGDPAGAAPPGSNLSGATPPGATPSETALAQSLPSASKDAPGLERLPPVDTGAVAKTETDAALAAKALASDDEPKDSAGVPSEVQQASATNTGTDPAATTAEFNETTNPKAAAESNADAKPKEDAVAADWRSLLDQTLTALDQEIAKSDGSAEADSLKIRRRLLAVTAERFDEAVTPVETLPREEREFWKEHFHGLSILLGSQGIPVPSRRNKEALRALRVAERHLAAASTLEIRDLAFCSRVESFGRFEEFEENAFQPSQEVLLYAALDNYATAEDGADFVTELQGSYQIVDGSGRRYADYDFLVDRQTCRDRRRDYFVPYRLYMPKDIVAGEYQLILTVEDKVGGKFGQNSIHFRITE